MQRKFRYVNLVGRSWTTWENKSKIHPHISFKLVHSKGENVAYYLRMFACELVALGIDTKRPAISLEGSTWNELALNLFLRKLFHPQWTSLH
jgi:hypothetical protein